MKRFKMDCLKPALILFVTVLLAAPGKTMSLDIEGNQYPASISVAGKNFKLIGVGLREKWFFDVYTMGAYSESGSCDTGVQMKNDEARYMRLDMLRSLSAEKISEAFREAFEANTPANASKELKDKIVTATNFFKKECPKGSKIEFIYIPGKGMTFTQDGKRLGLDITGKDFADVVWNCYFSNKTCCKNLKKGILKTCKAK